MHKFQKQGGYAANRRQRPTAATEWSRIERKIGSAASEHACGVLYRLPPARAIGGSLLSCSPLYAGVGWGRRSVGDESRELAEDFGSGRKASDGPTFAENVSQRRGHPHFESYLSNLWPEPTAGSPFSGESDRFVSRRFPRLLVVAACCLTQTRTHTVYWSPQEEAPAAPAFINL